VDGEGGERTTEKSEKGTGGGGATPEMAAMDIRSEDERTSWPAAIAGAASRTAERDGSDAGVGARQIACASWDEIFGTSADRARQVSCGKVRGTGRSPKRAGRAIAEVRKSEIMSVDWAGGKRARDDLRSEGIRCVCDFNALRSETTNSPAGAGPERRESALGEVAFKRWVRKSRNSGRANKRDETERAMEASVSRRVWRK
jgi:hypothetical protein